MTYMLLWNACRIVIYNCSGQSGFASAGYNEIVTVVVLGNQNAVDKVKKSEPTMNLDGSIILGKNSAVTATLEQEGIASIPFSLADGAYVDLSVKGALCCELASKAGPGLSLPRLSKNFSELCSVQSFVGNDVCIQQALPGIACCPVCRQ